MLSLTVADDISVHGYTLGRGGNAVSDNVAFGTEVLLSHNTTSTRNSGVGARSLKFNASGSSNTGYGWNSLGNNDTGNANTAVSSGASLG